jgi:hypothetical protein
MACVIPFTQPAAMATTQLARTIECHEACSRPATHNVMQNPLRMSWVVVTDRDGKRKLQIHWAQLENTTPDL